MKDLRVDQIRNVGLFGDGAAGKTALAEALLFTAGAIDRLGSAADGSTAMDFEPEEVRHRFSTSAAVHHLNWKKVRVNLVDCPGSVNFCGDAYNALPAVDAAIFVLDGVDGPRVMTEKLYARARELGLPTAFVVSKLDRERSDAERVAEAAARTLETKLAPLTLPVGAEAGFAGVVDLLSMRSLAYPPNGSGKFGEGDPAPDLKEAAQSARERLVELAAEADDALLEKYLEQGSLADEEVRAALRAGFLAGKVNPLFHASPARNQGLHPLLDALAEVFPSPADRTPPRARDEKTKEETALSADPAGPFTALVFKTVADPYAGQLTIFRVFSGAAASDSNVHNASRDAKEHVGSLLQVEGKKQSPIQAVSAGDIAAVAKLKNTHTGDTLCGARHLALPPLAPPPAMISFAITAKVKGEEDKILNGLHRLQEEDPAVRVGRNEATGDLLLSTLGQLHAEVTLEKLRRKFGVEAALHEPHVPYRETIKRKASAQGKYKKQSGGRGQYGDCHLTIEPNPGKGFEFVNAIVGGAIPRQYVPGVEKGVVERMHRGVIAGFPVVDVKVTVTDGSYHDVDSSEMAFKVAGSLGFKKAAEAAGACLLEPVMALEVDCPEDCVGDVIGDLNSRRGRVHGMEVKGAHQIVRASVPMAEILKYAPELRSITSGRGTFSMEFEKYEEVPPPVAQKILAHAKHAGSDEEE